jgi:hypothetical protein
MEFDWLDVTFDLKRMTPREVEESFEDPFSLRFLPEGGGDPAAARYFSLGKTIASRPVFSVFWTDGKKYRVVFARDMTPDELAFYERRNQEFVSA